MKTKKTPAPRRAGNSKNRKDEESVVLGYLDEIAAADPEAFGNLMKLLARLATDAGLRKK